MYVVATDPVAALRAELRTSLLRPSLPCRLWRWLVLGRMPIDRTFVPAWRVPGVPTGPSRAC